MVNIFHGCIGLRSQDTVARLSVPNGIQARHVKHILPRQRKKIFLLLPVPLKKARGGDHTPLRCDAGPEQRLVCCSLCPGVDNQITGEFISPGLQFRMNATSRGNQNRSSCSRADLAGCPSSSTMPPLNLLDNLENFSTLFCRKLIPPTHKYHRPYIKEPAILSIYSIAHLPTENTCPVLLHEFPLENIKQVF